MKSLVNYQEIEKAYNRISNYATKTPLLSSDLLNKEISSNIFIKAENLQKIGAFKFRGAMNSILKLDDDKKNVLAWSSGNHAQAIASACYLTDKNATIVMPEDSPNAKLNGTKSWGANVVTFDRYSESREEIGTNLAKEINVPIIALSQLSRAVENRSDRRPQLSDLRESGAIEQDADLVIFLYRPWVYSQEDEDEGKAEIIVAKQRNGPTGKVDATFIKQYARFENLSDQNTPF